MSIEVLAYAQPEECEHWIELFQRHKAIGIGHKADQRATWEIPISQIGDSSLFQLEQDVLLLSSSEHPRPLRPEYTVMAEMTRGDHHTLHADNCKRVGNRWVPNHTPQRQRTGILYLSRPGKDYVGGILHFPTLDQEFTPAQGSLLLFGCDERYPHEVTPVLNGHRYTVMVWLQDV